MPCRYDETPEEQRLNAINGHRKWAEENYAPLLCEAVRKLLEAGISLSPELTVWWHRHQEMDRQREAREAREESEMREARKLLEKPLRDLSTNDIRTLKSKGLMY